MKLKVDAVEEIKMFKVVSVVVILLLSMMDCVLKHGELSKLYVNDVFELSHNTPLFVRIDRTTGKSRRV